MKKLILKTALITLGAILAVICILYGIFALALPLTMANFFENLGMQDASVSFYELQYENTGEYEDLALLCVKVNAENDYTRAEKYLTLFVNDSAFSTYIQSFDEKNTGAITGQEYFYGKLAIAHQKLGGVEEFLPFAIESVKEGYSEFNAFYIALSVEGLFEEEELNQVENALIQIEPTLSNEEKSFLLRDLEYTKIFD